jgi:ATP-dependent exoDNAse (exonuclease V) beta subunit
LEKNGGKLLELAENFRSAREVVAFVNAIGEPLFAEKFPPMKAIRTDGGGVERLWIEDGPAGEFRAAEATAVVRRFKELRAEGHLWKTMALLFKTRKAVPAYEEALKAEGVPYRTSLGEPLLERPEILTLLFWMQKRAGASESETAFLKTALQHSVLKGFSEDLELNPLSAYLDGFFDKVQPLFPETVHRNLKAFQNLTRDLMSLGVGHLKALVQNLRTLREEEARIPCPDAVDDKADAVSILTVHGAKGLEWPIVAVCDLKAGPARQASLYLSNDDGDLLLKEGDLSASGLKTPLIKTEAFTDKENREREEGLEESKRLLYVALTRARDRLILPLPIAKADGKGKGRSPRWSDWLTL